MTRARITAIAAWSLLAGFLGLSAYFVLSQLAGWPRPKGDDLARGEALIRSQYATPQTRVGRVSLAAAGPCVMRGTAELIDVGSTDAVRRAACVVTIAGRDTFSATCR